VIGTPAATWSEQSAITTDLGTTGTQSGPAPTPRPALFRVAQDALSNVAKDAAATRVRRTLTYLDNTVLLDVVDNGTGRPRGPGRQVRLDRYAGAAGPHPRDLR
jgi:signal transduction histidine kinase